MNAPSQGGRPGTLTPENVRGTRFNRSQLGWRGYAEEEVEDFLGLVADAMTTAEMERAALRMEIERLRGYYREHGTDVDRLGGRRDPRTDHDLVLWLRRYADIEVVQAREYAEVVTDRGCDAAEPLLHHARVRAEIAAGEPLRQLRSGGGHRAHDPTELDRALLWLQAFAYAFYAQVDTVAATLTGERERATPVSLRSIPS